MSYKPIPTNIHILRGNPGRKPKSELVDDVEPEIRLPKPPLHLTVEAKREWKRLGEELESLGLVSNIDYAAFAVYCQAYGRWVYAEKQINKLGDDGLISRGSYGLAQWFRMSMQLMDQLRKMLIEFGMTPSSRTRVRLAPTKAKNSGKTAAKDDPARYFAD